MITKSYWIASFAALAIGAGGCDGGSMDTDGGTAADGSAPAECTGALTSCGDGCVDTDTNRSHCGGCDNACDTGEVCNAGSCELVCPSGQEICDGACIDTDTDRANCGGCGDACDAGEICADGACELSCPSSQVVCGGACSDTDSDPAHCGDCDTACDPGQVCDAGACTTSCSAGLTECSGACVDTSTSPDHCGGCDSPCAAGAGAVGVCVSGSCRSVCDSLMGDCNADLGVSGGDGCETPLATDSRNCGACGNVCNFENAVPGCTAGACGIATCDAGYGDCDGNPATGCETETSDDELNCGACGSVCATGESCIEGACMVVMGEDCDSAIALSAGTSSVSWMAFLNDYLSPAPSCLPSSYSVEIPDIVLSFTATTTGEHVFSITPPSSTRWVMTVSTDVCSAATELDCDSQYGSTMEVRAFLTTGQTAYLYVADTSSGSNPLDNPLAVEVTEPSCTTPPTPPAVTLSPADGATTADLSPTFEVTFDSPVHEDVGTVTLMGDMGTSLTYDLSTSPSEVSFDGTSTTMTVDPGMAFPSGEVVMVTVSGMIGRICGATIPAPSWTVNILDCSTFAGPSPMTLTPADGTTASTLSPTFEAAFDVPVDTSAGIVTVTGDMGTSFSYDLSTSPSEVTFDSTNTVMTIDPGASFAPFESVTISWTGIADPVCENTGTAPSWTVDIPCADLLSDPANCGSCGNMCPTGQSCFGGTCSTCPGPMIGGYCVYLPTTVSASDKASAQSECTSLGAGWDLCPTSVLCDAAVHTYLASSGCDCSMGASACACSGSVNLYVHTSDSTTSDRSYYLRGADLPGCSTATSCIISTSATCGVALCCR